MDLIGTDYNALLVDGGSILAFIEEERVLRKKNLYGGKSYEWCLNIVQRLGGQLDSDSRYNKDCGVILDNKNPIEHIIPHHVEHAFSAVIQTCLQDASILVIDGCDDTGTLGTSIFSWSENKLTKIISYSSSFSLGLLYCAAVELIFLGSSGVNNFSKNTKAGSLMGLATYAIGLLPAKMPKLLHVDTYTGEIEKDCSTVFEIKNILQKEFDLNTKSFSIKYAECAYCTQVIFENSLFSLLKFMKTNLPSKSLIITGGCGLNCTATGKILRGCEWDSVYIPPLCEDSGCVLGNFYTQGKLEPLNKTLVYNTYKYRLPQGVPNRQISSAAISSYIKKGGVLAWFEGGSEYGPRALCHRSILALPSFPWMRYRLNEIKNREYWRPFAPVILDSYFSEVFEVDYLKGNIPEVHEHMLVTEYVTTSKRNELAACIAPDGTSRPQVLKRTKYTQTLYDLMQQENLPVLVNTSMNGKGEPICETPEDALCFCESVGIPLIFVQNNKTYLLGGGSL